VAQVKRFEVHKSKVNDISIDAAVEFIASCSDDGSAAVRHPAHNLNSPLKYPTDCEIHHYHCHYDLIYSDDLASLSAGNNLPLTMVYEIATPCNEGGR
jgi:hypothetical protein